MSFLYIIFTAAAATTTSRTHNLVYRQAVPFGVSKAILKAACAISYACNGMCRWPIADFNIFSILSSNIATAIPPRLPE